MFGRAGTKGVELTAYNVVTHRKDICQMSLLIKFHHDSSYDNLHYRQGCQVWSLFQKPSVVGPTSIVLQGSQGVGEPLSESV